MKKEDYATPEMDVEEFDKDVFTENNLIPSGISTENNGDYTELDESLWN